MRTCPSGISVVVAVAVAIATLPLLASAGCSKAPNVERPELPPLDPVPPGETIIHRLQYNDTNDVYRAFVAGKPKGTPPLRLRDVRLALLTEQQIAAGKKPHLVDDGKGPLIYAGPRFKIGVLHGIVEQRPHPDDPTRKQNVVVRMERRVWSPFVVPKLVNDKNIWHTPAAHYPPLWGDGPLVGSGASAPTREAAYENYRRAFGELPQAVMLEYQGYAIAFDAKKADADADKDDRDGDADAGVAQASADAGPGAPTGNRVIGAIAGSKAKEERSKLLLEERKKKLEKIRLLKKKKQKNKKQK